MLVSNAELDARAKELLAVIAGAWVVPGRRRQQSTTAIALGVDWRADA